MNPGILAAFRTGEGYDIRLVAYAPRTRQCPHAHARDSVTLVLRGSLIERSACGTERAGSLSVVAKPATMEHEDSFGPVGAVTLQVILPAERSVPGFGWAHDGPECLALLRVLRALDRKAPEEVDAAVRNALDALAPDPHAGRTPDWLDAVRAGLAEGATPVARIARNAGVHPVHLARRFRTRFGVTPAAYRARMRACRAARALLEQDTALADVALDAGYCDQSHMNRDLRGMTGLTPRALRVVARSD